MIDLFGKLRVQAAHDLGIDPDRIRILPARDPGMYVAEVQGDISADQEQQLRKVLNEGSAAHIRWVVRATVRAS